MPTYDVQGRERRAPSGQTTVTYNRPSSQPTSLARGLEPYPGEQEFFDRQVASRSRNLAGAAAGQRQSLYGALEARGLGQSSVLTQGLGDIARLQNLGLQEAQDSVANQQFQLQSQRIRDRMNFDNQKELMRYEHELNKKPWWQDALGAIGEGVGSIVPFL